MSSDQTPRQIGAVINGRYLLKRRLGSGAAGEVFLAADGIVGQDVAIKFLAYRSTNQLAIEHFKGEFATLTTLRHPYITRVFDFAVDVQSQSYFFTSEYVPGDDFLTVMQAYPVAISMPLVIQILQALEYLHRNHIYHFDIKPKNVLVAIPAGAEDVSTAQVKLIDFGLASVNHANRLVGTPSYMAPEMIQRESPDHRADLYSLGVLLYYSLTGVNPLRGENRETTFKRHLTFVPPPPSDYNPMIPEYLDPIILRLLAKKREDRYYSAAHVLADLVSHLPAQSDTAIVQPAPLQPWEVRFVGRAPLLQQAHDTLDACVQGSAERPPLLWITGPAGSGKTRLLQEIKYQAQLLGFATHAFDRVDITARMSWLAAVDAARDQPQDPIAFFLDDITTLGRESATYEILAGMRDLLHQLRSTLHVSAPSHPIRSLVVMSGEDSAAHRDLLTTHLRIPIDAALQLSVENFSTDELQTYLRELMSAAQASSVAATVHANTQGHPMRTAEYITQMATLHTSASPVDSVLPLNEQEVADVLAVWGMPVTDDQLTATFGRPAERTLLQSMVDKGLLQHDPIRREYRFRNHSVQQQHYHALAPITRHERHDQIAALLLTGRETTVAQYFQHRLRGAAPYAAPCALWSLGHAQMEQRNDRAAATTWQQLAADLPLSPGTGCWMDIHVLLAEAQCRMHHFGDAMQIYRHLHEELRQCPTGQLRLMQVLEALGKAALSQRLYAEADAAFSDALAIATEQSEDPVDALRLENWLAVLALDSGDTDYAVLTLEQTARTATHLSESQQRQLAHHSLGLAYLRAHRLDDAATTLTHELHQCEQLQLPVPALRCRGGLAKIDQLHGEYAVALTHYKELLGQAAQLHDTEYLMHLYCEMGHCHAAQQQLAEAMQCYQAAEQHAQRVGDPWLCMDTDILIGNIHRRRNDIPAAETRFLHALVQLETMATDTTVAAARFCTLHYQLGTIYLRAADLARSEFHLTKARTIAAQSSHCQDQICRIALAYAEMLHQRGDRSRYKAALAEAKTLLAAAAANAPDHVQEMSGFLSIHESE